jgi:hypothetical protein
LAGTKTQLSNPTIKHSAAGLPDGMFSIQKYQFGKILEGLAMEDVGIFYDQMVYFMAV